MSSAQQRYEPLFHTLWVMVVVVCSVVCLPLVDASESENMRVCACLEIEAWRAKIVGISGCAVLQHERFGGLLRGSRFSKQILHAIGWVLSTVHAGSGDLRGVAR